MHKFGADFIELGSAAAGAAGTAGGTRQQAVPHAQTAPSRSRSARARTAAVAAAKPLTRQLSDRQLFEAMLTANKALREK